MVARGKERGYLLYDEVNDILPAEVHSSDEIDDLLERHLHDVVVVVLTALVGVGVPASARP